MLKLNGLWKCTCALSVIIHEALHTSLDSRRQPSSFCRRTSSSSPSSFFSSSPVADWKFENAVIFTSEDSLPFADYMAVRKKRQGSLLQLFATIPSFEFFIITITIILLYPFCDCALSVVLIMFGSLLHAKNQDLKFVVCDLVLALFCSVSHSFVSFVDLL
ncbi:hypothetical protein FH972_006742 [Carpinus fangiana]|uniref:Uncharacterized protein n=1 Tax=Carpinus fangiana TaxID=176857 RepID=A0A5N6QV39_9ROSI|nr:hypothetical protein FH972_006742 [Carpinus fangiana]